MYELHEFHLQSSINFAVQEIKPGQPVAELIKHDYKKLWNYLSSMTMDIFYEYNQKHSNILVTVSVRSTCNDQAARNSYKLPRIIMR